MHTNDLYMGWEPISESGIWDLILAAEARMEPPEAKLWECVRIPPQKWNEPTYGQTGGGFWAVGVIGRTVIWYNDIEDGFNQSNYTDFRTIGEYWCNQDELEHALISLRYRIESGLTNARACPPASVRL